MEHETYILVYVRFENITKFSIVITLFFYKLEMKLDNNRREMEKDNDCKGHVIILKEGIALCFTIPCDIQEGE